MSAVFAELDSDEEEELKGEGLGVPALPCYLPGLMGCRNVDSYEWLNRIEEGTYGVVHRGKDKKTGRWVGKVGGYVGKVGGNVGKVGREW